MQNLRLTPTSAPRSDSPASLAPSVREVLESRGVDLERVAAAPSPERELETVLMALFRDTRRDDAFEALYRASRRSLAGWVVHLLASRGQDDDPAEILQDTYVNVYRYSSGFRDEGGNTFRGWARTIAANVVRRAAMRRSALSLSALPSGLDEPEDEADGPERTLDLDEQRASLRRSWTLLLMHYAAAWSRLSERDQHALELVEIEGLDYRAAAARLGVGSSNMKMIMFRSRKRIRAHMQVAMESSCPQLVPAAPLPARAAG